MRFSRFTLTVLVSLGLTIAWLATINWVFVAWAGLEAQLLKWFGVAGSIEMVTRPVVAGYELYVPQIVIAMRPVTREIWWIATIVSVVIFAGSWLIPRRWLPARYLLRLLVIVQSSAQVFFWSGKSLPYNIADYTEVLHLAGAMVIGIIPLLFGFTFYPLDFGRLKKLLVTLMAMSHLCVFIPLQYLLHAVLLHQTSLILMPLVFWAFGLTVDVFVVISFYGWAASWEPLPYRHHSWWIPLRPALPALAAVAIAILVLGAAAKAHGEEPDIDHELRVGYSYGEYDRGLGSLNSQSVRYSGSRYLHDAWNVDVGRAARLGEDGVGFGIGYRRHLRRDTSWSAGVSSGTGEVLFPRWRADVGIEHGVLAGDPLLLALGYTHLQSKAENRSDGIQLGARWYTRRGWIFGLHQNFEHGHPGDTSSKSTGFGIMYHRPDHFSLSAGYDFGDVSYVLLMPGEAAVDFDSRSYQFGGSYNFSPRSGVGLRYDFANTDIYDLWSFNLEYFHKW
jgi:YaiO family outer membrane protein